MTTKLEQFFKDQGLRPQGTLAHFGVKGMRWGIRKDVDAISSGIITPNNGLTNQRVYHFTDSTAPVPTDAETKVLSDGLSRAYDGAFSKDTLSTIDKLNAAVQKDFDASGNWSDAAQKVYDDNVAKFLMSGANDKLSGTGLVAHVSGTSKGYSLIVGQPDAIKSMKAAQAELDAKKKSIMHSLESVTIWGDIVPILDDKGLVIDFEKNESVKHSMTPEEFIAHYGIRGMHWGVRRSDAELARAHGDSVDAIRAQETLRTIQSSGSLSSVSDSDLNHLINRINTERRYSEINPSTASSVATKLHSTVKTLIGVGRTMNDVVKFTQSDAGQIIATRFGLNNPAGKHRRGG